MNASQPAEDERTFFERERERLSNEISRDFEELISSTNMLNRKLEDVVGMRKEIDPIADLWSSFYQLMREQKPDVELGTDGQGIPGTGGHVV
ncbi:DASH outer kinetochore protein, partial [Hysterangium stoloniferum]